MNKRCQLIIVGLGLALTLTLTSTARAGVSIVSVKTSVMTQPEGPISINSCVVHAADQNSSTRLIFETDFTNTGAKTATSVTFAFGIYDLANQSYGTAAGPINGTFSTGALIQYPRHTFQVDNSKGPDIPFWLVDDSGLASQKIGQVVCYVRHVLFADGSDWNANPAELAAFQKAHGLSTATPSPAPT